MNLTAKTSVSCVVRRHQGWHDPQAEHGDLVESRDDGGDRLFDPHWQDQVIHAISALP